MYNDFWYGHYNQLLSVLAQPQNLAEHRPAWQTSTDYGGEASRAVDGDLSPYFGDHSCSHTGQPPALWGVDLEQEADIYYVEVLNRAVGFGKYFAHTLNNDVFVVRHILNGPIEYPCTVKLVQSGSCIRWSLKPGGKYFVKSVKVNNEIYAFKSDFLCLMKHVSLIVSWNVSDDGHSAENFTNFSATVSNEAYPVSYDQLKQTTFSTCGQHDGRVPPALFGRVTCSPNPIRGRYVYITLPDTSPLVLCEVRVLGGEFGISRTHKLKTHLR